jgi:hypothetical protein
MTNFSLNACDDAGQAFAFWSLVRLLVRLLVNACACLLVRAFSCAYWWIVSCARLRVTIAHASNS